MQAITPAYDQALHDAEYAAFSTRLRETFLANVGAGKPVFTTSAEGLFDIYLDHLPAEQRQVHNCNTCRRFFETYGALVTIDEQGFTASAMWDETGVPDTYSGAVTAMRLKVESARITGVFYSSEKAWGTPVTGDWHHLHVIPPAAMIHKDRLLTPGQAMAAKLHDFETLHRALTEFSEQHLQTAVQLLKTDALYRSEKVLGVAEWLLNLQKARTSAPSHHRRQAGTWLSVATSPAGFCHPRSSMIGTLLDDIAAGLPFDDVAAKFKAKMHPLQYQRPQAAPSAGNIQQAEKIVEKLGIAASLRRRFARLDEIVALWRPSAPAQAAATGGVFGHLKPKGAEPATEMNVPATSITWEKFARTVLPEAEAIECLVPSHGNFTAMVTAVDPDAPPILQWDTPERRNPVSSYVYHGGSSASRWGLVCNTYAKVVAIAQQPHMWHEPESFKHQGKGVTLVLEGARDDRGDKCGLALFPETLKGELHSIRSTIEAFSRSGKLEGHDQASACGIAINSNSSPNLLLRVTSNGVRSSYRIDRWD